MLIPTCSTGGSSCHSGEGARGDLVLDNTAHSYGALADFIEPGDAESSELMVRLEITGEDWSMPIGNQLDAGERCAIQKWIDAGAAQD